MWILCDEDVEGLHWTFTTWTLLEERGIKVELDTRAEKIGYKIREANGKYKIPVQLVLGKAEIENRTVNVRRFGSQDQTSMSLDEFLKMVEEENKVKF